MTHAEASELFAEAFRMLMGREPSLSERQALQAVSWIETNYGQGWKPPGTGSHNMGAITTASPVEGRDFRYGDSHRIPDGPVEPYVTWFRGYASDDEGARDLVRKLYRDRPGVLEAASNADLEGVAREMRETTYYEGVAPTREGQIAAYYERLQKAVALIAERLSEANAFLEGRGSRGGTIVPVVAAVVLAVIALRRVFA